MTASKDSGASPGGMAGQSDLPGVSVIVPVHNEETLLEDSVIRLREDLIGRFPGTPFEIVLVENGSRDRSPLLARDLAERLAEVKAFSLRVPSYGKALRFGVEQARYPLVLFFNVDLWDIDFAERALYLLGENDVVVGSKCASGSLDKRGIVRRIATRLFNFLLRIGFGFTGTDTHGMKGFRADKLAPIISACITDREVFDTEMILRAQRAGLRIAEVPVTVEELRPTRYNLAGRLPSVLRDLVKIRRDLR